MKQKIHEKLISLLVDLIAKTLVVCVPSKKLFSAVLITSRILTLPFQKANLSLAKGWRLSRDINAQFLRVMLNHVTQNGGRFKVAISGAEKAKKEIQDAYTSKNRLILCTGHFPLTRAILILLRDLGIPAVWVKIPYIDPTPSGWVWGIGDRVNTIDVSESILSDGWESLSQGYALIIMLDGMKKRRKSLPLCSVSGGQLYVASNLFRFASITKTPVAFFSSSLSRGQICTKIKRPATNYPENKMDIEAFLNLFIEFLKDEMITNHGFKDQDFPEI